MIRFDFAGRVALVVGGSSGIGLASARAFARAGAGVAIASRGEATGREACATLRAEGRDVRAWSPAWKGDAHAGRTETSLMLALGRPVAEERPVGATQALATLLPAMRAGGVRAVSENVLLEIQKTFDFFKATAASDHIDRIVLSGGASRVDGFREMLEERFNTPVEDFDPFKAVTWDPSKLGAASADHAATAAVAVGLALRKVGDR